MPSYIPPKKNTAWIGYVALVDQSNTKLLKANPTLAAGDVKVEIDGGAAANITTLPSASPAGGTSLKVQLTAAEMNGDNVVVRFSDAAGSEWCDLTLSIQTTAQQVDDLATPATVWNYLASAATTVGSLGKRIADYLDAAVSSRSSLSAGDVNAEVVDALYVDTYAEPTGAPPATASLARKISQLYKHMRNRVTSTGSGLTLYNDDGTTADIGATHTDDGTTYDRSEWS